jgi:uncharacterized protein (TIRG00374 family)
MHQNKPSFNALRNLRLAGVPLRLIGLGLVSVIVVVGLFQAPWTEIGTALATASPSWLLVALLASAVAYPLGVLHWRILAGPENPVSWGALFEIVALSSLAGSLLPGAAGVASIGVLLVGRGGLTVVSAMSLVTLDQLLVGVAKAILLMLAIALAPLPSAAVTGAFSFVAVVLILALLAVLLANLPGSAMARLTGSAYAAISRPGRWLARFASGLHLLRAPGRAAVLIGLALLKKAVEIGVAYAIQSACGIEASLLSALLAVAAVSITTAIQVVPASVGIYTGTVFAVYQFFGIPAAPALAAGLLQHAVELIPTIVFGYGALLIARRGGRQAKESLGA